VYSRFKRVFPVCLSLLLLATNVSPIMAQGAQPQNKLSPRFVPTKPTHTTIMDWQSHKVVQVKFVEGSVYRLRDGKITTLRSDPLGGIKAILQKYPVRQIDRLFTLSEEQIEADKLESEILSGEQMADLNLWYLITIQKDTNPEALIDALNALPEVEIASPALLPAPLPIKSTGDPSYASPTPTLASPNFLSQQGYINPATDGINAKYAWKIPGGTGSKVTIVDVEYSFNKNHEDFPSIPVVGGQLWNGYGNDHGTAVLGEMVSKNNSYGVKGIAYGAKIKFSSACMSSNGCNFNLANAISLAKFNTTYGDVILIEQQNSVCNLSNYGPVEWDQAVFDAIKLATAGGRIVVEAAGNGSVDLDAIECNGLFDRNVRDSGAIIVGAGSPPTYGSQVDRSRLYFSTYGSRVDVQGWGFNVASTGYSDLYTGTGKNQWYTASFNGTSSSSPIVAGAAAVLSSVAKQRGLKKSPSWIRSTLTDTGSPQQNDPSYPATQHIGPRPDLKTAIAQLGPDFASDFNVNASGWNKVQGNWKIVLGAYYKTTGIVNKWSSIVHDNEYTTLDLQVAMKRKGCLTCANGIIVRGKTIPLGTAYDWNKGYAFHYSNNGYVSVWEISPGGETALLNWTTLSGINTNDWNTLRVIAEEKSLTFYINDLLVWSGSDSTLKTGSVGIETYRFNETDTSPDSFRVDWASMSNVLLPLPPIVPAGLGTPITDWRDYRVSP